MESKWANQEMSVQIGTEAEIESIHLYHQSKKKIHKAYYN
jgi:hypothetical protein